MKIEQPLHVSMPIETYNQALFFFIDDDPERVEGWISQQLHEPITLTDYAKSKLNTAIAFELENVEKGRHIFVVWMKWWGDDARSYGRLGHELIHTVAAVLTYVGYVPKFKPEHTEPIAYLHEAIMRSCLTAIELWKQRAHEHARRVRKSRRQNVRAVQRPVLANAGVGKGRNRQRRSARR